MKTYEKYLVKESIDGSFTKDEVETALMLLKYSPKNIEKFMNQLIKVKKLADPVKKSFKKKR